MSAYSRLKGLIKLLASFAKFMSLLGKGHFRISLMGLPWLYKVALSQEVLLMGLYTTARSFPWVLFIYTTKLWGRNNLNV